jgi:co-chaperonin GroES (HSP10)
MSHVYPTASFGDPTKWKILRDRVLVERLEYKHPVLAVVGIVLQKGRVVNVGYGRRKRRLVRFEKMPGMSAGSLYFEDGEETGVVMPMKVKVGDIVEFSPRDQFEFSYGGKDYLVLKQNSIYGTSNDSADHEALLWQQSGGYDREGHFMSGKEHWHGGAT